MFPEDRIIEESAIDDFGARAGSIGGDLVAWGEGFAVSAVAIDIGKGIAIDGPRVGDGVIRLIDLIADKLD